MLSDADGRYGYSFEYPSNWRIVARDDRFRGDTHRGVLTVSPLDAVRKTNDMHEVVPAIVIGIHTSEFDGSKTLRDWSYSQLNALSS